MVPEDPRQPDPADPLPLASSQSDSNRTEAGRIRVRRNFRRQHGWAGPRRKPTPCNAPGDQPCHEPCAGE